jgi:hypothetical protein
MFLAPEPLFVEVVMAAVAVPVLVLLAVVVTLFPLPVTVVDTEACAEPVFAPAPFTNSDCKIPAPPKPA